MWFDDDIQAKPLLKNGKVSQLLDLSLGSGYNNEQIERMVLAATLCISRSPRLRPQINIVFDHALSRFICFFFFPFLYV